MDHIAIVSINQVRPGEDIARLLEDPITGRTTLLTEVGIWSGNDSLCAHPPNSRANHGQPARSVRPFSAGSTRLSPLTAQWAKRSSAGCTIS